MKLTLRDWREAREITMKDMAAGLEIHRNTYFLWEHDPEKIPIGKAFRISGILKVPITDIIWKEDGYE